MGHFMSRASCYSRENIALKSTNGKVCSLHLYFYSFPTACSVDSLLHILEALLKRMHECVYFVKEQMESYYMHYSAGFEAFFHGCILEFISDHHSQTCSLYFLAVGKIFCCATE